MGKKVLMVVGLFFVVLAFSFYCLHLFNDKTTVIYRVGSDFTVQLFEVVGDTALLSIKSYDSNSVAMVAKHVDSSCASMNTSEKLAMTEIICREGLAKKISVIKISVKGIKHPIVLADAGWDDGLDTLRPQTPINLSFWIDSTGGIFPGK